MGGPEVKSVEAVFVGGPLHGELKVLPELHPTYNVMSWGGPSVEYSTIERHVYYPMRFARRDLPEPFEGRVVYLHESLELKERDRGSTSLHPPDQEAAAPTPA